MDRDKVINCILSTLRINYKMEKSVMVELGSFSIAAKYLKYSLRKAQVAKKSWSVFISLLFMWHLISNISHRKITSIKVLVNVYAQFWFRVYELWTCWHIRWKTGFFQSDVTHCCKLKVFYITLLVQALRLFKTKFY